MNTTTRAISKATMFPTPANMKAATEHLRNEKNPSCEWDLIPAPNRDLFVQYEPQSPTLRNNMHNLALYRFVTQRLVTRN